ncbi:hypothetical protein RSOLAG22IIIB_13258 [Rhizoctonia solani]|uniref:Kex protein n=1 Tax=Rhizoctonia solani TaxID=456999 RepID=A0A0K6FLV1_9AGAM|nr:hypothetical protein RSOLAG22IIIB_13258 [Rhizoctonia solani]
MSVRQLCKTNTKDAFKGMILPAARPRTLSVLGHLRKKETRSPRPLAVVGRFIKNCLFRRISPVETRVYAFTRNSFATVAIGILIFRAIAALQQAQNEINTRVTSGTCDEASQKHYISVLSDRVVYDSGLNTPLPSLNISVSIVFTDPWGIQGGYRDEKASEMQMYLPPLELVHGSRIIAKANLVTRRFLKSSIVKDIIFRFKSEFRSLSLYPMVEASKVPLNASDANVATAIIRPVLTPGFMYHRNEVDARNLNGNPGTLCDYVEDYRSGTIIDVIGSIGGLFALLQAMHLLLFGRPLLWGLTGAKMITPFGLLGQCSSRSFRRRLKEGYHVTSSEDGTETIQIVKFLQHFVIDFGPANVDLEQRPASPAPVNNENPADARTPSGLWKESDGGSSHGDRQDRIQEIV